MAEQKETTAASADQVLHWMKAVIIALWNLGKEAVKYGYAFVKKRFS